MIMLYFLKAYDVVSHVLLDKLIEIGVCTVLLNWSFLFNHRMWVSVGES